MEEININLYGGKGLFGGKEAPLEAEITYCDKYKQCSFYKNGKCFSAGRWKPNCKYGKKKREIGYTSRARKYQEFKNKYINNENYHKLEEPNDIIGKVGEEYVLNLSYLKKMDNGKYEIETELWGNDLRYIQKEDFTNELIKIIVDGQPKTIFDNCIIKSYQEEKVPRFLYELKTNFKNIYGCFIKEYPQYRNVSMNFKGRQAYIDSLKNGSELKDCHGNKWVIENNEIVCYNWETWLPFKGSATETRIKIKPDMKCEITDNEQVQENTRFAD